jgi:hypothetical protein
VLYVIKLGPIETGEGPCHAYVPIRDDGYVGRSVMGRSDTDALREIAANVGTGETLLCEQNLARAGKAAGFAGAPMPAWAAAPRAALAVALALGPDTVPGDRDALHLLFHGATEFLRAAPWTYWNDSDPIEVVLAGAVSARFEAALMGGAGIEYGVALYRNAGAMERIAHATFHGGRPVGGYEASIAVTFDDEPRFAIAALRDAYGLERMPIPMKVERDGRHPIDGDEVAILGAALRLLATVTVEERQASLVIGGDRELTITMPTPVS